MTLVTEDKVEHALAILADKDGIASSARAAHQFEAERTKTIKARLMARCNEKSVAAREMYALAHEEYEAHLKHVQILAENDLYHRDRRQAAQAVIDVWRSENATNRTFARASQ